MPAPAQLFVGLGNPGARYADTRHNVGTRLVESFCQEYGGELRPDASFSGRVASVPAPDGPVRCFVPDKYMNLSGLPVARVASYYRIPVEQILIAHDDLDLAPGVVRLKTGGGHGGHNGLRDVIRHLGSGFMRIRFGIGHPGDAGEVSSYVLRAPPPDERLLLDDAIVSVLRELPGVLSGDWKLVMNRLHRSG